MNRANVEHQHAKIRNRVGNALGRYLTTSLPHFTPGQIETLRQHPELMEQIIRQIGLPTMQALMSKQNK